MWLSNTQQRGPTDDFWYTSAGGMSAAGVRVSPEQAMRLTVVYACVRVLSETIAQLPLILYRRLDRGKERATDHPLFRLIGRQPNEMQTSFEYREMMQGHLSLRGNGFSEILYKGSKVVGLKPYHPDLVRVEDVPGGYVYYVRDTVSTPERRLYPDEVLHLRGLTQKGVMGLNPIETERDAIGFSLAAQDHGSRFYRNGAMFPGWIEHPTNFKDREARAKYMADFQASVTGANKFSSPVMEYGMKYHEVSIKHTDAQYLETRKHEDVGLARMFRMPPHKVGILDRATNNNIEHQGIEFVSDTMMPWGVRWEQRLNASLLTKDEQEEYFFEFLFDGLLRGDASARSDYYNKGVQDGWLTRNEVRELENRNPLPGLDEPLEPLNMARASEPRQDKNQRERALNLAAAQRVLRKEQAFLQRAAFVEGAMDKIREFYTAHADHVRDTMMVSDAVARAWCDTAVADLAESTKAKQLIDAWHERAEELANIAEGNSQ